MENLRNTSTEALLLGIAISALSCAQEHLMQDRVREGLSTVNDALRKLNQDIQKHFYKREEKNE